MRTVASSRARTRPPTAVSASARARPRRPGRRTTPQTRARGTALNAISLELDDRLVADGPVIQRRGISAAREPFSIGDAVSPGCRGPADLGRPDREARISVVPEVLRIADDPHRRRQSPEAVRQFVETQTQRHAALESQTTETTRARRGTGRQDLRLQVQRPLGSVGVEACALGEGRRSHWFPVDDSAGGSGQDGCRVSPARRESR